MFFFSLFVQCFSFSEIRASHKENASHFSLFGIGLKKKKIKNSYMNHIESYNEMSPFRIYNKFQSCVI